LLLTQAQTTMCSISHLQLKLSGAATTREDCVSRYGETCCLSGSGITRYAKGTGLVDEVSYSRKAWPCDNTDTGLSDILQTATVLRRRLTCTTQCSTSAVAGEHVAETEVFQQET